MNASSQTSTGRRRRARTGAPQRVAMLLENCSYPRDVRVSREARALVAAGHDVTVIAPRAAGEPRAETIDGVKVRRFRVPPQSASASGTALEYAVAIPALHLAAIRELIRGATVLHLHNPPDLLFGAGLLARALGRAVVYDQHDLFPELVEQKIGSGAPMRASHLAERATFSVATHVLAANESHARVARERGQVRSDRVTVVRNGPPISTIVPASPSRPGPLEDPELIYVGVLGSQDGAHVLADLLARVQRDHGLPGARMTVVGDGDDRARLEAALAGAGVSASTTITGWVTADVVRERLAAADICVDPSPPTPLNQHSTMIKIGEYLPAGKPIVAYDLLETRRTAGDGARLVAAGDSAAMAAAIAELAHDGEARDALADAASERAPAISWEHSVDSLLDAYSRLGVSGEASQRGLRALATLGGLGRLPRGPATAASLAGALVWRRLAPGSRSGLALVAAAALAGQAATEACVTPELPDPDFVVIDELAGVWLTLWGVPATLPLCLGGAVIFRIIDKLKPGPVGVMDRSGGRFSVIGDDLVAGLVANLLIRAARAVADAVH